MFICNGELSSFFCKVQQSSTASFEFFRIFIDSIDVCLCVQQKQVGILWLYVLFQKENFSIVWCLKTTLISKATILKMRFLFMWIIEVTKTSNTGKSRVLILATLGSVYSPHVPISVRLKIK